MQPHPFTPAQLEEMILRAPSLKQRPPLIFDGIYGIWLRERVSTPTGKLELEYLRESLEALGYPVTSAVEVYNAVQAEIKKEQDSLPSPI